MKTAVEPFLKNNTTKKPLNQSKMKDWEEEAANLADPGLCKTDNWIEGAKYAAETLYSEEEVLELIIKFNQEIREVSDIQEWFEPFKKQSGDPPWP